MKATLLTSVGLLLVSFPALADHAKRPHPHHAAHARTPTAMHTTQVHQKDASSTTPEEHEQEQLQQRVRVRGVAAAAAAAASKKEKEKEKAKQACLHEPITISRGTEEEHIALTRCDGSAVPEAVDHLSVLARPESIARPAHGAPLAGVRRVDAKLAERLQQVSDHFGHGHPTSMHIVSGFRPNSVGSFHASAQALDFRVDGVKNEDLVAFCKTLQDTGCGYYPNSSFVHMDVRAPGTGHVSWIDASGPGETAHYVSAWPPPPEPIAADFAARLAKILPALPVDLHPAQIEPDHDSDPNPLPSQAKADITSQPTH